MNGGATAYVKNLTVTVSGLANVCDGGADRLRGIMFEGASGSITHNAILDLNQGASGCQEGNAIEVRNAPFDGTHPDTQVVEIANNRIDDFQKTGIVANGDVSVNIHLNRIADSATQAYLAANSIQVGFGATGSVTGNVVEGNQWLGASNFAASAILIFAADGVNVSNNNVRGNSDVGIWALGDDGIYDNNRVLDFGTDGPHGDFGIVDQGSGNTFTNNKVKGFDSPFFGVAIGNNKAIPAPQN